MIFIGIAELSSLLGFTCIYVFIRIYWAVGAEVALLLHYADSINQQGDRDNDTSGHSRRDENRP